VVLWDASNETHWSYLGDKVIPVVRKMDLSDRPWENGYNGPQGSNDPYETHPYKFVGYFQKSWAAPGDTPSFEMSELEKGPGHTPEFPGHAAIINEYDWLWLHRDGRPTVLTKAVFDHLVGPNATADERFFQAAYLLAGLTEHWRATRQFAAVMYLAYLDGEAPHIYTNDNFKNVKSLEFQPHFEEYMGQAFKPLGVNVDFWQPKLQSGSKHIFSIVLTNDTDEVLSGKLVLTLAPRTAGVKPAQTEAAFEVPALGQAKYDLELSVPSAEGQFQLKASANCGKSWCPTVSRRRVAVTR